MIGEYCSYLLGVVFLSDREVPLIYRIVVGTMLMNTRADKSFDFYIALLSFCAFWVMPSTAQCGTTFGFHVISDSGEFSISPNPNLTIDGSGVEFTTGRLSSADGMHVIATQYNGWLSETSNTFSTQAAMVSSVDQPWSLLLDEGLPTERTYTLTADLGNLATIDLTAPTLIVPTHASSLPTALPTFEFVTTTSDAYFLQFSKLIGSSYSPVVQTYLAGGVTSWTASTPLSPGDYRFLLTRQVDFDGTGFFPPVDELGEVLQNWSSFSYGRVEVNASFSIVPEASSQFLLLSAMA
jgi:hypothetical protein